MNATIEATDLQYGCLKCGAYVALGTNGAPNAFCATCAPPCAPPYTPTIAHKYPAGGLIFTITSESSKKLYTVNLSGVRPVCSCPAFGFGGACKHIALAQAAMPALEATLIAQEATDRAARKAARQTTAAADIFGRAA